MCQKTSIELSIIKVERMLTGRELMSPKQQNGMSDCATLTEVFAIDESGGDLGGKCGVEGTKDGGGRCDGAMNSTGPVIEKRGTPCTEGGGSGDVVFGKDGDKCVVGGGG